MQIQDLTIETMHTLQRLILLWAHVNASGFPGEELPGEIFDSLDGAQQLNTRLMEINGWTAGWQEMVSTIPPSREFPRRATRVFEKILALPEESWPELLAEAIAAAYGKGWESRVIQVGDRFLTFASDVNHGNVVFKADLYRAFHILNQFCQLSDHEIKTLLYKRPYMVFAAVNFRDRRHRIFQRLQMWHVISPDEEMED